MDREALRGHQLSFADQALARRLERAEAHANAKFAEAWARAYPESGATWIEVAGAYAMFDGVDSPTTQSFGLGMFAEPTDRDMERLERFFAERGAKPFHEVSPLAGLGTAALLSRRGYRPVEFTSVLYRPIGAAGGPAPALNPAIRVRPIAPHEGPLWAEVSVRGWSEHPELAGYLRSLAPLAADREDALSFLAEVGGEAIAAGALALHGGVALLAGACTVPEGRRRGAQLALLHERLAEGGRRGCDLAMMCAEPGSASQRNAERQGFRVAYTRIKWGLL